MKTMIDMLDSKEIDDSVKKKITQIAFAKSRSEAKAICEDVLSDLFKTKQGFNIPFAFINSDIGKYILRNYVGLKKPRFYSTVEVAEIIGKTSQLVRKHLKEGKIIFSQFGPNNQYAIYLVSYDDLIDYMVIYRKMTYEQAEAAVMAYEKVKTSKGE